MMTSCPTVSAAITGSNPDVLTSTSAISPQPEFSLPVVRNCFILRFTGQGSRPSSSCGQPAQGFPELKSIIAQLLSFGDMQKLELQHWRELGVIIACYFDTRDAEEAFDYMLGEEAWQVIWSEGHQQNAYFVSIPAKDLAVCDPNQYGDMANILSPPGNAAVDLELLIHFFDCRAARAMREAREKTLTGLMIDDPGSTFTACSSLVGPADFGISSLVNVGSSPWLLDTISRVPSLARPLKVSSRPPLPYSSSLVETSGGVRGNYCIDLDGCRDDPRTTIMIKHIPNKLTQQLMLQLIDGVAAQCYDFFYLPIDLRNRSNVGYAFINFVDPTQIVPFYRKFHGLSWESFNNSKKICHLSYARIQGKDALMRHFSSATLPKNPAMQPLFRVGHRLYPLRVPGYTNRHANCVAAMTPPSSSSSIMSLNGLLPKPVRARTLPVTQRSREWS